MYQVSRTNQFKKDVKTCVRRGYDMASLLFAMSILEERGTLPAQYHPHPLLGKYKKDNIWDGHILPDWLLLWRIVECQDANFEGEIVFVRTGTHADLF